MSAAPDALVLRHASKVFGGQKALDDVTLSIRRSEILGLVGQNGCGKSTLIKILAGYHHPEPGAELEIDGSGVHLPVPLGASRRLGLSFVHQDLALVPSLTVVENFRARKIATSSAWAIRWSEERRVTEEALERFGVRLRSDMLVADLSSVDRALLAIVRAFEDLSESYEVTGSRSGVLILDEPTVFLPRADRDEVFRAIEKVVEHGASVLFVSHDLEEALAFTDRVTVLRDGQVAGTTVSKATSKDQLIEMIIGRRLEPVSAHHHKSHREGAEGHVAVENLNGGVVHDVSFWLEKGEVLGITGLGGSGFEAVPYLLFGATGAESGSLRIGGECASVPDMSPASAIKRGMALIPADRQNAAGVGDLHVSDNVMLQMLEGYRRYALQRGRLEVDSRDVLKTFDVRPPEPRMQFQALSGGNQQKVVLAKWLQTRPSLLLVHEPTQGVDVGARRQVTEFIVGAAENGMSVVCASSDAEQLADMCDRVLVFHDGAIADQLTGSAITKDRITERCYVTADAHAAGSETGVTQEDEGEQPR